MAGTQSAASSGYHDVLGLAPAALGAGNGCVAGTGALRDPGAGESRNLRNGVPARHLVWLRGAGVSAREVGRKCAYSDGQNVPLEIEHIQPKSFGGSDRVSNLMLACRPCNQRKGNQQLKQFLAKPPERTRRILAQAKAPLRDAAVNSSGWALFQRLKARGLEVEVASGGRTKWNRRRFSIPKTHCLEAVCGGQGDAIWNWQQQVLQVQGRGCGSYQRTRLRRQGFLRGYLTRSKSAFGFQTADLVWAVGTTGKKVDAYLGRVAIGASGNFNIQTGNRLVQGQASTDSAPCLAGRWV